MALSLVLLCGCDRAFGLTIATDAPAAPDAPIVVDAAPPGLAGVVARFRMDEVGPAGGPCLIDDSGHGLTGACIGDPVSIIGGQNGGAFELDGNTRIQIASTATGAFTIAGWFMYTSSSIDGMCPFNRLLGVMNGDSWQVCIGAENTTFYYQGVVNVAAPLISPQVWHHLAIASTGTDVVSYVDGAPVLTPSMGSIQFDGSPIMLGADLDQTGITEPVIGALDDVWLFDRALSQAEILSLESL